VEERCRCFLSCITFSSHVESRHCSGYQELSCSSELQIYLSMFDLPFQRSQRKERNRITYTLTLAEIRCCLTLHLHRQHPTTLKEMGNLMPVGEIRCS
jgi:hypothetical protein